MRDELFNFANEQEKVLQENDYKHHWRESCSMHDLRMMLDHQTLMLADLNQDNTEYIRRRALHIANYAMMIHDKATQIDIIRGK